MDRVYIGQIVGCHGIKGELRILSNFPYKDKVFVVGKSLWIEDKEYVIKSYRVHKNYDMVTVNDYHDINEVLFLVKKDVYFKKEDLNLLDDEVLDEDLLTFDVYQVDGRHGRIQEIFFASPTNKVLRILFDREVLIPMNSPMIEKIDKEKKQVIIRFIDGV